MNAKIWDVKTQNMITAELKLENALGKHYQDNEGNWYNVVDNNCTEAQISYIQKLDPGQNYAFNKITKDQASKMIDNLKKGNKSCHYCGMPAKSFGFFDEPICEDCSH